MERVRVTFEDAASTVDGNLAALSAVVTYSGVSAQGEALHAMQNRLSWVLRTSDHVPRIVHEHTSALVGFEDMKSILLRSKAA